jgi:hypothetical protein
MLKNRPKTGKEKPEQNPLTGKWNKKTRKTDLYKTQNQKNEKKNNKQIVLQRSLTMYFQTNCRFIRRNKSGCFGKEA